MTEATSRPDGDRTLAPLRLLARGRDNFRLARQISFSTQCPEDAAQVLRKAVYQLLLALLPTEARGDVTSFADCRARVEGVPELEPIVADILPELSFLDDLVNDFALVWNDRSAHGDRLQSIMTKLPATFRSARRSILQRDEAGAAAELKHRLWVGGGVTGAVVLVIILVAVFTSSDRTDAPPNEASPASDAPRGIDSLEVFAVEWPPESEATLTDESRCFRASYFRGADFDEPVETRRECRVLHNWPDSGPFEGMPVDGFSARWTGTLQVPKDGAYTFIVGSDDGARLFVNGEEIINTWYHHAYITHHSAPVELKSGQDYPILLEYYEYIGMAQIALLWKPPDEDPKPVSGSFILSGEP